MARHEAQVRNIYSTHWATKVRVGAADKELVEGIREGIAWKMARRLRNFPRCLGEEWIDEAICEAKKRGLSV